MLVLIKVAMKGRKAVQEYRKYGFNDGNDVPVNKYEVGEMLALYAGLTLDYVQTSHNSHRIEGIDDVPEAILEALPDVEFIYEMVLPDGGTITIVTDGAVAIERS